MNPTLNTGTHPAPEKENRRPQRGCSTAIVMRETQVSSPASLVRSIYQTCVVRPRCTGRAVPITQPLVTERMWFALMSSPTARSPSGAE